MHNKRNKYDFRDRKTLWLEPTKITINGDYNFLKDLKISGSTSQSEFEKYNLFVDNASKQINETKELIHLISDQDKKSEKDKIDLLQTNLSDSIVEFMLSYPNSQVTLFVLHDEAFMYSRHLSKRQIKLIYDNLSISLKESETGKEVKKYIELPEPPTIGDFSPEIAQITIHGDTVKLSDFRGKYVLVDFWASWCGPCRASHKWMKKLHNKYNDIGFEILGISGDHERNSWINAMKQDSVTWPNVSDLNGWKNEAFLLYDIKNIPRHFLINPGGVIISDGFHNKFNADKELEKAMKH